MLVMHLYFVCNMNKIARIVVLYILVLATTGADELIAKYKTSTTTQKSKEITTTPKWKERTTKHGYEAPLTKTNHKELLFKNKSKIPRTTILYNEITTNKEPTTTTKWKAPSTTIRWKDTNTSKSTPITSTSQFNHKVFAVASFSGIDSRNKRLSSINDVKIFPAGHSSMVKTDDKGNFILKSDNGKMPTPITITKQGNGVSGTIRILPGSISVSSSSSGSNSGPVSAVASYNPWRGPVMKPIMNDLYFPQFPTFPTIPDPIFDTRFQNTRYHTKLLNPLPFVRMSEPSFSTRMQDPWFHKDMFKKPQSKHDMDMFTPNWFYPSFNPFFNYW